jgi:uncharacterized membrane protein YhaH (DUF805 family)
MRLLFDDEGVISRRSWWIGTVLLLCAYMTCGAAAGRVLALPEHADAAMLFASIAILVPFHAVNAKRFRAIGRPPALALWGGGLPAASVLTDAFLNWPSADIVLGWLIMAVMIWFVIDLGLYPHESHASRDRIDAAANHA